jgi:hypothetical protein
MRKPRRVRAAALETRRSVRLRSITLFSMEFSMDQATAAPADTQHTSNFMAMCKGFSSRVDFMGKSPVASPAGSPFDSDTLVSLVESTIAAMPREFQGVYGKVLQAALPSVCAHLKQQMEQAVKDGEKPDDALAEATATTDTIVGAVRDWSVDAYRAPLRRFEAVVSNLYRSFLDDERRRHLNLPLTEVLPPLVTFAADGSSGPFTLPIDAIRSLFGASVAVVSLPGTYREHPLVWPALAHETGGHDVSHANVGLLDELRAGVKALDGMPKEIASLWSFWIDETASDMYGLLNVGPAFALTLAAMFASARKAMRRDWPDGVLDNRLLVTNHAPADPHPVELLRLHAVEGAIGALVRLSQPVLKRWQDVLADVTHAAAGGKTTVDVVDANTQKIIRSLPLDKMAQAAREVGAFIVTAKLKTLEGHTIQDIETWDDADEQAALGVHAALAQKRPIVALGDDAQLLAGATMAYFDDASKYDAITAALNDALDDSFQRDPVFGALTPHFMFDASHGRRRGRAYHRTYRSLQTLEADDDAQKTRRTAA